jgi:hypothetical protein
MVMNPATPRLTPRACVPCAPAQQAALLGGLSFFMAWVVQAFFAAVLLDIVDAVFVCYAMDRDTSSVTQPQVHEVFSQARSPADEP